MANLMLRRLGHVVLALARMLDVVACTLWLCPLYLIGLASRPTGTAMISSYVGAAELGGMPWAIRAARIIDYIAKCLGDKPRHCYRSYLIHRIDV
jgi:hypothetical protein